MKKEVLFLTILVTLFVFIGSLLAFQAGYRSTTHAYVLGSAVTNISQLCDENNLQGTITIHDDGKRISGQLVLENKTIQPCSINGKNTISLFYNKTPENANITIITMNHFDDTILLEPHKTITTQFQSFYGSFCKMGIHTIPLVFEYTFPNTDLIVFQDKKRKKLILFPICQSLSEISQIQIWNFTNR